MTGMGNARGCSFNATNASSESESGKWGTPEEDGAANSGFFGRAEFARLGAARAVLVDSSIQLGQCRLCQDDFNWQLRGPLANSCHFKFG